MRSPQVLRGELIRGDGIVPDIPQPGKALHSILHNHAASSRISSPRLLIPSTFD
jgi:hypothetical protein